MHFKKIINGSLTSQTIENSRGLKNEVGFLKNWKKNVKEGSQKRGSKRSIELMWHCNTSTLNKDKQLGTPRSVAAQVVTIHIKHPNQLAPNFGTWVICGLMQNDISVPYLPKMTFFQSHLT